MRSQSYAYLLGVVAIPAGVAVLAFSSNRVIDISGERSWSVVSGLRDGRLGGMSLKMFAGVLPTTALIGPRAVASPTSTAPTLPPTDAGRAAAWIGQEGVPGQHHHQHGPGGHPDGVPHRRHVVPRSEGDGLGLPWTASRPHRRR
jgi:hypothetical protein